TNLLHDEFPPHPTESFPAGFLRWTASLIVSIEILRGFLPIRPSGHRRSGAARHPSRVGGDEYAHRGRPRPDPLALGRTAARERSCPHGRARAADHAHSGHPRGPGVPDDVGRAIAPSTLLL